MVVPFADSRGTVDATENLAHGLFDPAGRLRLPGVAALAMAMSDRVVATSKEQAVNRGESVSCGKGCAACCRELIPISPAEAFLLHELVLSQTVAGRKRLGIRFQGNRERLQKAHEEGLFPFQDPGAYFSLGIPCPFLADEACSIHPNRPLACREHLVQSPALYCGSFPNHSIQVLSLEGSISEALSNLSAELLGRPPERIYLHSALEWAEAHAEEGKREWNAARIAEALVFHLEQVS